MERNEYLQMAKLEERMWWFRATHEFLLFVLHRSQSESLRPLLDAGCGTGGFLYRLAQSSLASDAIGIDLSAEAVAIAKDKSKVPVSIGTVDQVPFANGSCSTIVSIDTICHRFVDPEAAAREANRCLAVGGICVIHVPAYEWLRSYHDEHGYTARRYTRRGLQRLLNRAGFRVTYCTYRVCLLFPLMVLRRKVFKRKDDSSDVVEYRPMVDSLFTFVMDIELLLFRLGIRFPFGGSVVAVGMKDG